MSEKTSDELLDLLEAINKKLQNAKALNGAFDTLLIKIETIEEYQKKIDERIQSVHDAIYDPDDGLFARIKSVGSRQENTETDVEDRLQKIEERDDKLDGVVHHVEEISKWKKTVTSATLWATGGILTGGLSLLAKIIYTLIVNHH